MIGAWRVSRDTFILSFLISIINFDLQVNT